MYYFCTYFDRNYLYKGLALYRSLIRHSNPFVLWILCFDDVTYNILSTMNLSNVRLVKQEEFERNDEQLQIAKQNRSQVEYYWTCTPSWILYVLTHNPEIDILTYLDADLYFYSTPSPIYEEFNGHSILIVEHRYAPEYAQLIKFGIYNVSFLCFRRDYNGLSCLYWWRDRCLEWCHKYLDGDKFGDQKYLNDWPSRFQNVVVLQHKGANVAPWNVSSYRINRKNGQIFVDSYPLIFYHFHMFYMVNDWLYIISKNNYKLTPKIRSLIYAPYILEIRKIMRDIRQISPNFNYGRTKRILRTMIGLPRSRNIMFAFGSYVF
jgi:hypothetical protein